MEFIYILVAQGSFGTVNLLVLLRGMVIRNCCTEQVYFKSVLLHRNSESLFGDSRRLSRKTDNGREVNDETGCCNITII